MIHDPRWATQDGKVAHLLTDSYSVDRANPPEYREAWCGQRLEGRLTENTIIKRCGSCLRKIAMFSSNALTPIADRIQETVTVVVERPVSKRVGAIEQGEDSALDLVTRALNRRREWVIVSAEVVKAEPVDTAPVEESE